MCVRKSSFKPTSQYQAPRLDRTSTQKVRGRQSIASLGRSTDQQDFPYVAWYFCTMVQLYNSQKLVPETKARSHLAFGVLAPPSPKSCTDAWVPWVQRNLFNPTVWERDLNLDLSLNLNDQTSAAHREVPVLLFYPTNALHWT